MDKQEIISQVRGIILEHIENKGLDLVDLVYRYEGGRFCLRILVDRPEGGISMDECAQLNKDIGRFFDDNGILLEEKYILEVSSPGMDRRLMTKNDFLRCLNRQVKFFLKEPLNGRIELEGVVIKAEDDKVCIDNNGVFIDLPLSVIAKAKQIISYH